MKLKKGFSLIEVTFVVLIMGILFSAGVPLYINIQKDAVVESESRELLSALSRGRQQSIKQGIPIYVYPVSLDDVWTNGWISYANEVTIQYDITTNIKIDNTNNINAIKFDSRGRVFDGVSSNPINQVSFLICDKDDTNVEGRRISINFLGKITTSLEVCL